MKTLGIYARVSTDEQASKGKSIQTQISYGKNKAKELGFRATVYKELGQSASKEDLKNRPQLQQLLNECKEGAINALYVIDEDRLSRNMNTKVVIKKILKDNNVHIYSTSGKVDFNDADSSFLSDLRTLLGQLETDKMSTRIKRVLKNSVENGGVGTGKSIPFGYMSDENKMLVIHPENKLIIQRIYKLCIEGNGTKHIASILNNDNILSSTGKLWRDGTIYSILKNTAYYGQRYWQGEYYNCPAIITEETFNKATEALQRRGKTIKNERKYVYLLNDLLVCANCGKPYRGRVNISDGSNIYKCTSNRNTGGACGAVSINRPMAEELVTKLVNHKVEGLNLINTIIKNDIDHTPQQQRKEDLKKELKKYEDRKKNLLTQYAQLVVNEKEFATIGKSINDKIHNIKSHLESMNYTPSKATSKELNNFNKYGVKRKQDLLKKLFNRINISYKSDKWTLECVSGATNQKILRLDINKKGEYKGLIVGNGNADYFIPAFINGQTKTYPFKKLSTKKK